MVSTEIIDNEFGHIMLKSRNNARNIIFRIKERNLQITTPPNTDIKTIRDCIERKRESIRKLKQKSTNEYFKPDDIVYTHDFIIIFEKGSSMLIGCRKEGNRVFVTLPPLESYDNVYIQKSIGRLIRPHLRRSAQNHLPSRLKELAQKTQNQYAGLTISHGQKRLGTCNTKREITLSYHLMCLPDRLIDYVILHELAHLHAMNHGPLFHNICNDYCNGMERILEKELKQFKFPFK